MAVVCSACGGGDLSLLWGLGSALLTSALLWALAFTVLSLALAAGLYRLFLASRILPREGRYASAVRGLSLTFLITLIPLGGAEIGFFEGLLRASRHQMTDGALAARSFPALGSIGADLVGAAVLSARAHRAGEELSWERLTALTAEYRADPSGIPSRQIPELLAELREESVDRATELVSRDALARFPTLEDGTGRRILEWFLRHLGRALVLWPIDDELEESALEPTGRLFRGMLQGLPSAAGREGDLEHLSHDELSRYIVEATLGKALVGLVVVPFCRTQQLGGLVPILLALAVPFAIQLTSAVVRWLRRPPGSAAPESP